MKKINTSPRAQARRTRALTRFTINAERAESDKGYAERKAVELSALKKILGV
jgi:hypothetical protein